MIWKESVIELDYKCRSITLRNDKSEYMASVIWFDNEGPFYAYAMDGKILAKSIASVLALR